MEAIILAGGFGTRLSHIVSDVPKPMAPINGIPFLNYILEYLLENGITRVILAVGYKKEIIKEIKGEEAAEKYEHHKDIQLDTAVGILKGLLLNKENSK